MYGHVPQVFLTLAIFVVLYKTMLYGNALTENNAEFKKMHKKRLSRFSMILKVAQLVSFILIGFRFITTCNYESKILESSGFTFIFESYAYVTIKIVLLVILFTITLKYSRLKTFPDS